MIKVEQWLIWLGVASLGWMIFFLKFGDSLDPGVAAFFEGEAVGAFVVVALFIGGLAGAVLLLVNTLRGLNTNLFFRFFSLAVFLVALTVFGSSYFVSPVT